MVELVPLSHVSLVGSGLKRPECVLSHASGLLFASDWTEGGGVAIVSPESGAVRRHLARDRPLPLRPNGIWLEPDASFLLAHLGEADGGVYRLHPDGSTEAVLTEIDGDPLPPTNFAMRDGEGRLYVTVSTRRRPRHAAAHAGDGDGFIVLMERSGRAQIVADGLGYTNECALDPRRGRLFVNETFGRRTSAFDVAADGSLGARETVATYGEGVYPDGVVLDAEGDLVVTSIVSNTVLRVRPDGQQSVVLADRDEARIAAVEARYRARTLDRAALDLPHRGPLLNVSSLAFGGTGLATAFLGCLLGDSIAQVPLPFAGARPPSYDVDLAPLASAGLLPHQLTDPLR